MRAAQQGGAAAALRPRRRATTPPLFGVVSRLTSQKGLDLLLADAAGPRRPRRPARAARLGRERRSRTAFADAARAHPGAVACVFGYDEALAHLMQAGIDFIVVPSRFEPCGLTQLCGAALRRDAGRRARRRPRRHRDRRQRRRALAPASPPALQFAPPDAGALCPTRSSARFALYRDVADDAAHPAQRHARRRLVARARQTLRRALSRPGSV